MCVAGRQRGPDGVENLHIEVTIKMCENLSTLLQVLRGAIRMDGRTDERTDGNGRSDGGN